MKIRLNRLVSLFVILAFLFSLIPAEITANTDGSDSFAIADSEYFDRIQSAQLPMNLARSASLAIETASADNDAGSPGFIVVFNETASKKDMLSALAMAEYQMLGSSAMKCFRISGVDPEEFQERNKELVFSFEPENTVTVSSEFEKVDDSLVGLQWAVDDLNIDQAWSYSSGDASIKIAVIDTGIYAAHEDFENTSILSGWDFVAQQAVTGDVRGHGTMVSGAIAATSGNAKGIIGACLDCTILPLNIFQDDGYAYDSEIVDAIFFAADSGCQIINMSFGGAAFSIAVNIAVQYARSKNCILIAAAGNTSNSSLHYPASYDGVISVAAYDQNQEHASFSTYNSQVDVSAPGVEILLPTTDGSYASSNGTSFSAPYVSGIAALAAAIHPGLTQERFMEELESTCVDIGPVGRDDYFGLGRIDTVSLLIALGATNPETSKTLWTDTGNYDISWYDADKTSFEVGTPSQLAGLAWLVNQGNMFRGKTVTQTRDINLVGHDWVPIGYIASSSSSSNGFQGIFDGRSYEITNMKIDIDLVAELSVDVGFFGNVNYGAIMNVRIGDGSSIRFNQTNTIHASNVGGVVGFIESDLAVTNCHNEAMIYIHSYGCHAGGIAGNSRAPITDCTNDGKIIAHGQQVFSGGISAFNESTIRNSSNTGYIMAYGLNYARSGGIVAITIADIRNSFNTGTISATGKNEALAGGIAAIFTTSMIRCFNTGSVMTGSVWNHAGGIAGNSSYTSTDLEYCTNYGNVRSFGENSCTGGIIGQNMGSLKYCQNSGTIGSRSGSDMEVGGIAGYNGAGKVENSINYGIVNVEFGLSGFSGGIVGYNCGLILNSSNQGAVSAYHCQTIIAGGIAGANSMQLDWFADPGILRNSYNTASVSGNTTDQNNIGGVVGNNVSFVENTYSTGTISGLNYNFCNYIGGIAGVNGFLLDINGDPLDSGSISNSYWQSGSLAVPIGSNEGAINGCATFDTDGNLSPVAGNTIIGTETELLPALNTGRDTNDSAWQILPGMNNGFPVNFISVSSIEITGESEVAMGSTITLAAGITPIEATVQDIIWSVTAGTGTASVDESGTVTGICPGTVTIRATAAGGGLAFTEKTITILGINYTITWMNGDVVLDTDSVPYGTLPSYTGATPTKTATAQYTYTFTGWTPEISNVTGNATYSAVFSSAVNNYTITWMNGDAVLDTDSVPYGTLPSYTGATPTMAATAQYTYIFTGWTPEISNVTGNAIYSAVFSSTVNNYTVTWMNGDALLDTDSVPYGTMPSYTGATPTKTATAQYTYTFTGWTPEISNVTGNATYSAVFSSEINRYNVNFDSMSGSAVEGQTIDFGALITEPTAPTLANHTFNGWYKESGCVHVWNFSMDTVIADMILYAKWTTNAPTFIKGDATGDGKVDALDLLKVKKHLLGQVAITGDGALAADVTGDGKIDALDLLKIKKYLLGQIVLV